MNKINILLTSISLGFILTNCIGDSKELHIPHQKHLYINAIAPNTSSELKAVIGVTQAITETTTPKPKNIQIKAHHNSLPINIVKINNEFTLSFGNKITPGDKITLTATSNNLPTVSTICEVPKAPHLLEAKGEWATSEDKVKIILRIEPHTQLYYYRLIVRSRWHSEQWGTTKDDLRENEIITIGNSIFPQSKDILFNELKNAPFALLAIQNQSEIVFEYNDHYMKDTSYGPFQSQWEYNAEVELQRISKDYYLYLLSSMESENNNVFDNPIKVHSNINGGFGIFEIYSPSVIPVSIK